MGDTVKGLSYIIDAERLIIDVSGDWDGFARQNDGFGLSVSEVLNTPLLSYIHDLETKYLYDKILQRACESHRALTLPFRCDSPDLRRFMQMHIRPLGNRMIMFKTSLIREEPRASIAVEVRDSGSFVRMCSYCLRVRRDEDWVELEDAIKDAHLFEMSKLPMITHGICPSCKNTVFAAMGLKDSPSVS